MTDILLPPAGRAEFVVNGPSAVVSSALLSTLNIDTGPDGDNDPTRPLIRVRGQRSLAILASVPRHSTDPGLSDRDRELLLRLETHGWYVIKVGAGNGEPAFAYSLGLYETFGHPELILFGLNLDTMHQLINDAGEQIKNGKRFKDGQQYDDLLADYPCAFRSVRPEEYSSHLKYTRWFYQSSGFPVLQMVWPDRNSCFPWDANFDERHRRDQAALYR